jgi:hypothetical protein
MINDKDEWGNISIPGISDEELYTKNWNMVAAQKLKMADPKIREKIRQSNIKTKKENPLTKEQRLKASKVHKGKKLKEILGSDRAEEVNAKKSIALAGKKRPVELMNHIHNKRIENGSYKSENHGMNGKTHKESTKIIQGQKAKIRQALKQKLGLGRNDSVPKDLLEKEYKKHGLQ